MTITYTSPHHSPEDPGGLIREVLNLGADFPGPAADILVSWSLRLADDLPPHVAARRVLERYGIADTPLPPGACGELVGMLRKAAEEPASPPPRRRGGWQGRRN